jgi:hypothetical protein
MAIRVVQFAPVSMGNYTAIMIDRGGFTSRHTAFTITSYQPQSSIIRHLGVR